jgi:hypothetical protein
MAGAKRVKDRKRRAMITFGVFLLIRRKRKSKFLETGKRVPIFSFLKKTNSQIYLFFSLIRVSLISYQRKVFGIHGEGIGMPFARKT